MPAAAPRPELEAMLGAGRAGELRAELHARARAFADRIANQGFHTASAGASLSEEVEQAWGAEDATVLLVVWPEVVRLGQGHAAGALEDLAFGADVVVGPVIDGGLYLLGLRQPFPNLLRSLDESLESDDPGPLGLAAASAMGLEIGLLRVERGLHSASDVEAALADPLTPEDIRRILSGADRDL